MVRTNSAAVAAVLVDSSVSSHGQGDYDGTTDLTTYIETASAVVDDLSAANPAVSSSKLEIIERWLAAHYYTIMDPIYVSKSTQGASASFQKRSYLEVAMQLDTTGYINGIMNNARASGFWLGTAQDQYADR